MIHKELLLALVLTGAAASPAQVSVRTQPFSFGKPVLVVRGEFQGENGTTWMSAAAGGTLVLTISNSGPSTARRTVISLSPSTQLKGIRIVRTDTLGDIEPGGSRTEKIDISTSGDTQAQKGTVAIVVKGEPGSVSAETSVDIAVREVPAPHLGVRLAALGSGPQTGGNTKIVVHVRNMGSGEARGVSARFLRAGAMIEPGITDIGRIVALGTIAQGSSKEITLTLKPAGREKSPRAFVVRLDEERPAFSVSETLTVQAKSLMAGTEEAGFTAFKKGDYSRAIASFERVAGAGIATKEVYYCLGYSYFKSRNQARCLSNMQKSSALGSTEATGWLKENTASVEVTTVTYKQINPDLFEGYTPPVGLGVLPFVDTLKHDTPLTQKIYDALKAENHSFRIFPYSTIKSEQVSWGLTGLDPSNKQILSSLEKELAMNFAVAGLARDSAASAFNMRIIRCRDGTPVFTQEFRTSKSATAIEDAVMFLMEGRVPVYEVSRSTKVKLQ